MAVVNQTRCTATRTRRTDQASKARLRVALLATLLASLSVFAGLAVASLALTIASLS